MIRTERLLLREPRRDDDLAAWIADTEIQRWLGADRDPAEVIERWVRRWERDGVGQFVVEIDGALAGRVGFVVWDARTWETSAYGEAGAYGGRGYATEAARAARDWLEPDRRIVSLIRPDNARSRRVAEKLGARIERRVETSEGPMDLWTHPA